MPTLQILLTLLYSVYCSEGRYQELPLVDTAACAQVDCDPDYKYRTIDGSCTSLDIPHAAQALRPYIRFIPAFYADGKEEFRRSVEGGPLPLARPLSAALFPDRKVNDCVYTINLMQFGQVLGHDIAHKNDRPLDVPCCGPDNELLPRGETPSDCRPLEVLPDDPFYSQYHVRCLRFVKVINNNNGTCYKYPIEKGNFVTSIVDGSFLYGNDDDLASELRSFRGGKLRIKKSADGGVFPPQTSNPDRDCPPLKTPPEEKVCFLTGDDRANQNTEVTLYQVIFLRLHNILCDRLAELNPHWSDETLYQEARRIVGAIMQHISYKEFLPALLGYDFVKAKGLLVDNCEDCCINYHSADIVASTLVEFAGAYRTFHSLVPREFYFVNEDFDVYRIEDLDDYYFRPSLLMEPCVMNALLRGLAAQPQQRQDEFFSSTLTNFLFKVHKPWGLDLEATDLQRGRDFGLPPYNQLRGLCGLGKAKHFNELADVMTTESILKLSTYYKSVDDIDLIAGISLEEVLPGTLVGPTVQCIVGEQMYLLMRGDRFYYENCGLPWSFTKEQLKAIYQVSLAWVFCVTGDDLQCMTYNTFIYPSYSNPVVSCSKIPELDLSAWQEQPQEDDCR